MENINTSDPNDSHGSSCWFKSPENSPFLEESKGGRTDLRATTDMRTRLWTEQPCADSFAATADKEPLIRGIEIKEIEREQ